MVSQNMLIEEKRVCGATSNITRYITSIIHGIKVGIKQVLELIPLQGISSRSDMGDNITKSITSNITKSTTEYLIKDKKMELYTMEDLLADIGTTEVNIDGYEEVRTWDGDA